jgi:hypothetical protein
MFAYTKVSRVLWVEKVSNFFVVDLMEDKRPEEGERGEGKGEADS